MEKLPQESYDFSLKRGKFKFWKKFLSKYGCHGNIKSDGQQHVIDKLSPDKFKKMSPRLLAYLAYLLNKLEASKIRAGRFPIPS